jgi:uncharacterized protein (DUF58 family)
MRSALSCALLGVLLLLVAGTFDAEPFYVTGAALLLLGVATILWIGIGSWGASITRTIAVRSVMEDQPLELRVDVRAGRLPLPPGFIDEALLDVPAPIAAGHRASTIRVRATFGRRGRRTLQAPALVLRDPLGLAERVIRAPHDDEILVLPAIHPVTLAAGGGEDNSAAHARALLTAAAETEIDGLMPYRPGAPASRIHWASVARGGEMMERKLIADADSRPLVVLDPRAPATLEDLDAAVRAAASLTRHFATRSGCGLLLPGDRRAVTIEHDMHGYAPSHVRLALLESHGGPALAAAQNRRGLFLFVSARVIDKPPRGLGRTPGGQILVVPGEIPGRRAVFTVAGCSGYLGTRTGSGAAMEAVSA